MKLMFVVLILTSLLPMAAFANGGQTGSGMNGCWIKNKFGVSEWRSIEEIYYPEIIIRRGSAVTRTYDSTDVWFQLPNSKYANLNEKVHSKRAKKRMMRLQSSHPLSYKLFIELFKLFEHVQVSNKKVRGLFRGEISPRHAGCYDFSPAMLTFNNGSIVVFRRVFEKLDMLSAQVLYVHESIRFAQTFHPAFFDLTDKELQLLTSLFFLNRTEPAQFKVILDKFEARIKSGYYKISAPRPMTFPDFNYNTELMFRHKFEEAVFYDESNLGTLLNNFRMNDIEFKQQSYETTEKVINSGNR